MSDLTLDLTLAALPHALGLLCTWRLIWPRWKVIGKSIAYFGVVAWLSSMIGHWSLVPAYAHQGVGLALHLWFCRRHGFTWYAVEDPQRYVALSKQMVGMLDDPSPPQRTPRREELPPLELRTMQCEGEAPPSIELFVDEDFGEAPPHASTGSGDPR